MTTLVAALLINPLLGFIGLSLFGNCKESTVSRVTKYSIFAQWFLTLALAVTWLTGGAKPIETLLLHFYQSEGFKLSAYYLIDIVSISGLLTVTTIFVLVTRFSRYYLHRDSGYQRYFAILQLFMLGLVILMLAGNLDFLFAGWEFLGISSFLLIGFYHHRESAIKNSLWVLGIYRFTDIGLILGAWLKQVLFPEAHRFFLLQSFTDSTLSTIPPHVTWLLTALILLAAIGKSAQFPLSFWLSKAMEGPTSSSAIFYGALSLHAGVFLLLRTFPFWFSSFESRLVIFGVGALTVFFSGLSSQSQANIKARLAYAACFHVGLQFIELSFGLKRLALIHVITHMLVRCYQFLISPAIVTYGLRIQNMPAEQKTRSRDPLFFSLPQSFRSVLYVVSFNEGYLEYLITEFIISPFQSICRRVNSLKFLFGVSSTALLFASLLSAFTGYSSFLGLPQECLVAIFMFLTCLAGIGESGSVFWSWNLIGISQVMFGLFAIFASRGHYSSSLCFMTSIFAFWGLGLISLKCLFSNSKLRSMNVFYSFSSSNTRLSHLLLICFLGISGFPLFPAFLGEDLVLHHLVGAQAPFAFLGAFILMLNGISAARLYTRVCWGPTSTV